MANTNKRASDPDGPATMVARHLELQSRKQSMKAHNHEYFDDMPAVFAVVECGLVQLRPPNCDRERVESAGHFRSEYMGQSIVCRAPCCPAT